MNTERQYVYKYVDGGIEKYVGITNDLPKRFYQHTRDKLNEMKNPDVYYFPVKHRGDADMLETYLINYYNTGKYYNVAKTQKGDFSFLDVCDRLPWVLYDGNVNESLPLFSVSGLVGAKNTEFVYKTVPKYIEKITYVNDKSTDKMLNRYDEQMREMYRYLDERIEVGNGIILVLENMLKECEQLHIDDEWKDILNEGIYLHKKLLQAIKAYKNNYFKVLWVQNREQRKNKILYIIATLKHHIDKHEIKVKIYRQKIFSTQDKTEV